METLQITAYIAAAIAVIMFVLTLNVSMHRVKLGNAQGDMAKYPFQDGGDEGLKHRIRAFGNFIEYTPFCIIMLGLLALNNAPATMVWGLGIAFLLDRLSHAFGMLSNPYNPTMRILGMFTTYAILLVPAIWIFL